MTHVDYLKNRMKLFMKRVVWQNGGWSEFDDWVWNFDLVGRVPTDFTMSSSRNGWEEMACTLWVKLKHTFSQWSLMFTSGLQPIIFAIRRSKCSNDLKSESDKLHIHGKACYNWSNKRIIDFLQCTFVHTCSP